MKLPRSMTAPALAGVAALALAAVPATAQAQDGPEDQGGTEGLYGEADATFDGVLRQSTALLALHAAEIAPADSAVAWLTAQQCEDGSFTAYRADAAEPCADDEPRDTNATGLAVQALAAVGGPQEAVSDAVAWLDDARNADGGWGYTTGEPSDANSTAAVIGGLAAAGADTGAALDALRSFQLECEADAAGGYAWQSGEDPGEALLNEMATVDAVLASFGSGMLVAPAADGAAPAAGCADGEEELSEADSAEAGAAQLAALLEEHGQSVPNFEGEPDFGTTSKAVLALAAAGYGETAAGPLGWLEENHTDWAGYSDSPGALAQLALAAHAAGGDPADFGGTDLLAALTALGPAPGSGDGGGEDAGEPDADAGPTPGAESAVDDPAGEDEDSGSAAALLWILGAGMLIGIGIGVALAFRRQRGGSEEGREAGDGGAAEAGNAESGSESGSGSAGAAGSSEDGESSSGGGERQG